MRVIPKPKKIRIDSLLVAQGLARDLAHAQALVLAGSVVVAEQKVLKPSQMFLPDVPITIKTKGKYVSRGGDKMADAISQLGLSEAFYDSNVLDIGASTGGFSDALLERGARRVVAIDVGFNQLAWKLRQDPRVVSLENTDIRNFNAAAYGPFDWVVADISFNTLARLASAIWAAGNPGSRFLLLVKPQFELPSYEVPKGGVVHTPEMREKAVASALTALQGVGFSICGRADLTISGRKGNWEVMLYLKREAP
jgi:23S rRNA (cytidine1920-2'-O)/16S rRNA (cytidine1409-2'-O)-methyltransferase